MIAQRILGSIAILAATAICAIGTDGYAQDSFVIGSPAFSKGASTLPMKFAGRGGPRNCNGGNVSPPLQWKNPPPKTRSFAIFVTDMDGVGEPNGAGLVHWIAYGIPVTTTFLAEGAGNRSTGKLLSGKNTLGLTTYSGPCPQVAGNKAHEYDFSIVALDLDPSALPPGLDFSTLWRALSGHELNAASMSMRYSGN